VGSILVTGGAGYIGSHTVKALGRVGGRVVVYDDLSAGHREAVGGATLVEGDVRDVDRVRDTIRRHGVEAVMHFAARLSVAESVADPVGYYRSNVGGALGVIEAMAAEGIRAFVFSSTCAVYGEPDEAPIVETVATQPVNAYGETKLAVERALPHFERAYGISSIRLRYFNAAGADPDGELGEDHDPEIHLIPRALDAVMGGPELKVFGDDYPTPDGTCLRDYIHVTDLAEAHVLALEALLDTRRSGTYNLGTGRPSSVREIIDAVEKVVGRPVPWTLAPRRPGDPPVLFAAADRAQADLKWRPRHSDLLHIVETAWRWHRAHPHGYDGTGR
jgi:UDP-glucose 4-epimerase